MKIVAIKIKNYRAFENLEVKDVPAFCVIIGANGTGKSTLFDIFGFLRDALKTTFAKLSKSGVDLMKLSPEVKNKKTSKLN